jgi:hypothetical protein
MSTNLTKEIIKSCIGVHIDGGHERVVGVVESIEDIPHEFTFFHYLTSRYEFGAKLLHLGKVLGCGEIEFLCVVEGAPKLLHLGARLGGKQVGDQTMCENYR